MNVLSKEFYKALICKGEYEREPEFNTTLATKVVTKPLGRAITLFNDERTRITFLDEEPLYFSAHSIIALYCYVDEGEGATLSYSKLVPFAKYKKDGITIELDEVNLNSEHMANVKAWIEKNAKKFKIRVGQPFHVKKLFAMITAMLRDFAEKDKEIRGIDEAVEIKFNQQMMKEYLTSCNTETIYIYETEMLGSKTFAEMNRLILECYAVHENTNSNSCMVKRGEDWTKIGADYNNYCFPQCFNNGVWIHPFQAYNTESWKFAFASKYAPEKVLNWDNESKSPFIARAILNDYSNGKGDWRINDDTICYGAREIANRAYSELYQKSSSRYGSSIRLYRTDNNCVVMPYIDGNDQSAGDLNCYETIIHDDVELTYTIGDIGEDHDDVWESTGGYVIADAKQRYEYCEILNEDIPAEHAVWISSIEGYVHFDFATSDGELDGLALFCYFR